MKLYVYSHLPPDFTNPYIHDWFNTGNNNLQTIDIAELKSLSDIIINNDDFFFLFEPQNPYHLNSIINFSNKFNKKNTFIFFFENVFDSKSRHIWKNNNKLLENFKYIFSLNYRICDNRKFFWVPNPTYLMNYKMINVNYFRYYLSNKTNYKLYTSEKFDVIKDKHINNFDENINIIKKYSNKNKYIAVQPIGGSVDDYRINIIKKYDKLINDLDCYGLHPKLLHLKNYKGLIMPNKINSKSELYSNRRMRSVSNIETLSSYKFILVFENECIDGYFSERFIDGLISHSIIIYYGSKNPKKFFPDLFKYIINGYDFENEQELLNFIKNMSQQEYEFRINEIHKLLPKYIKFFSMDNIMNFITNKVFEKEGKNKEECILLNNLNKIKELD